MDELCDHYGMQVLIRQPPCHRHHKAKTAAEESRVAASLCKRLYPTANTRYVFVIER